MTIKIYSGDRKRGRRRKEHLERNINIQITKESEIREINRNKETNNTQNKQQTNRDSSWADCHFIARERAPELPSVRPARE